MAAPRGTMYAKMAAVFVAFAVGGPALMYYVTPAEGEVFARFNPELQKRSVELRDERMKNYQEFLDQLKEHSKSDKSIWVAQEEARAKARAQVSDTRAEELAFQQKMREEMRLQAQGK